MLLKALDFIRTIGWAVVSFIYDLIDVLFDILKELNAYNIIDSLAGNTMFSNFHKGVLAISVTLLGLFSLYKFVMKIIEPDDGMATSKLVTEIIKSTLFVLLSVFLFSQVSTLSIKLSGFTASIFSNNKVTISDNMLTMFVDYSKQYELSDEFKKENYQSKIKNDDFTNAKMYNDKFVTNDKWILKDEKDYKYSINWILAIIVGGFFLYALFFSGMMLARRQLEFLFLFVISPIVFSTSIGNKQRRSAVIEQLVSLMLQGAVVMLIISLTAIVTKEIGSTTFFSDNTFKDVAIKSLLYIGAGTFLLTGSQVINRFIGSNVSVNSGREQLMSLIGVGQTMNTISNVGVTAGAGATMVGLGGASQIAGAVGVNKTLNRVGETISSFGKSISSKSTNQNSAVNKIGSLINRTGSKIGNINLSSVGKDLRRSGFDNIKSSFNQVIPPTPINRNRYKER